MGEYLVTSASSENIAKLVIAKLSDKLDQNVTQALSGRVVLGKGQRIPAEQLKISASRAVQAEILSSSDHVVYYPTRVKQSQGKVIFEYDLHNRLPRSVTCTLVLDWRNYIDLCDITIWRSIVLGCCFKSTPFRIGMLPT